MKLSKDEMRVLKEASKILRQVDGAITSDYEYLKMFGLEDQLEVSGPIFKEVEDLSDIAGLIDDIIRFAE